MLVCINCTVGAVLFLPLAQTGVRLSTTKEGFFTAGQAPSSLHESWAFRILPKLKITHRVETSAGHVDICEQNPVCKWGRDTQHRNKNSEQNVSPFQKEAVRLLQVFP